MRSAAAEPLPLALARCLERDELEQALVWALLDRVPQATAVVALGGPGAGPSLVGARGAVRRWREGEPVPPVLAMPVRDGAETFGWIGYVDDRPLRAQLPLARAAVREVATAAAVAAHNARRHAAALEMALRDPLTGLFNRRALDAFLDRERQWALRHDRPLSLVLLDLDHFKPINDRFGHAAGDRVLVAVADALRTTVRRSDVAARLGGDEFAIVLPDTAARDALRLGRRIRRALAAVAVPVPGAAPVTVTASAGVADIEQSRGETQLMLRLADAALYRAKRAGRNRVRCASAVPLKERR